MPAARYWRIVGVDTWGGGDLELSALHLHAPTGRVDASATLACSHAPASGALAALQDGDGSTLCRFSAQDTRSAGFAITWDFGAGNTADVWAPRPGAGATEATFLATAQLQYFDGSQWVSGDCGAYTWPGAGALVPPPSGALVFGGAATWAECTSAGSRSWNGASMSADGLKMVALVYGGYIYTSADGGATWTERTAAGSRNWTGAAMSADGATICASSDAGYIYTSADGGATWTGRTAAGARNWRGVAVSSDGLKMAACVQNGYIYTSANGGATWTERTAAGFREWRAVACSADGSIIVGVTGGSWSGPVMRSADGGATWTQVRSAGYWYGGVAVSASGATVIVARYNMPPSISADGGVTWTEAAAAGSRNWRGVAVSADGLKMAACAMGDYIYTSADGGATWAAAAAAGVGPWFYSLGMSAAGNGVLAGRNVGYLYRYGGGTLPEFVEPPIRSAHSDARVAASSTVPALLTSRPGLVSMARDVEFGGHGVVSGTVKRDADPVDLPMRRRVRLFDERSGLLVREAWSEAATGAYSFAGLDATRTYTVVAYDHDHAYRAVIADNMTPEAAP